MENYTKGESHQVDGDQLPVFTQNENALQMRVAGASKIRNLMTYATTKMKSCDVRQVVWSGVGNAVAKTITCAEIMKGKIKDLHQVTSIRYVRVVESWEPKIAGLDRLQVNKDLPAISILLSKDSLDPSLSGYQAPGEYNGFWKVESRQRNSPYPRKRTSNKPPNLAINVNNGTRSKNIMNKNKPRPSNSTKFKQTLV